jgi:serine protease Do
MEAKVFRPVFWLFALILIISMACMGGNVTPTVAPQPAVTQEPVTVPPQGSTQAPVIPQTSSPVGFISSLDNLDQAVVYIEAEGTMVDPEEGWQVNVVHWGTGFVIDPSGLVVTNNHVVTGAALLKARVGNETQMRSARVVAVSECSDLALISVTGQDFPYLQWFNGSIKAGQDVYVAGFPDSASGVDYTLTKGIISKPKTSLESTWASVQGAVIGHTARTNPGNSGGPLVNTAGEVLGVNYAGVASTDENYSIGASLAKSVVNQLKQGQDIESIGINGAGVSGDLQGNSVTGVWVRSVKSGSPADKARLQPGDIIISIENKVFTQPTMQEYCDIIRAHKPSDTMSMTVIRSGTLEVFEGQLNGRVLAQTSSLQANTTGSSNPTNTPDQNTANNSGSTNAVNSGDVYFSTEFNDSDNWYKFAVPKSDNNDVVTDNGFLEITIPESNETVYALYDQDLPADVQIDASVQTVGGPNNNNISLVCRATDQGWYEFSMGSGGYWYIWRYDTDNKFTKLADGGSTAINLQRAKNDLTATCIGSRLTFYVNSVRVGSVSDSFFKNGGQAGVSASTFDVSGTIVNYDWFEASVP